MDVNLMEEILSQCVSVANHHNMYFKCLKILAIKPQ